MFPEIVYQEIANPNLAQIENVDGYLKSIALPSTFISKIDAPQRQLNVAASSNISASLDWFMNSPEFDTWKSEKSSSFLWCSGIPKSGKTVLSCYLENYLRDRPSYMTRRDVIAIFCRSDKERKGSIEIGRILGSIASQLLRRDDDRLKYASHQHRPQGWIPPHPPLSFGRNYLDGLWRLVRGLMDASSDCEIDLILDGVNEIRPEQTREAFLTGIVTLFEWAKSVKHIALKVFVTSIAFKDVQKAFEGLSSIEKDKERQGYTPQADLSYGILADVIVACLKTLRFEEYNARQNRVSTAEEHTGDWILTHHEFKKWDESPDSDLLWLYGKPGSGKSTLAKRVVASKAIEPTGSIQMKGHNASLSNLEKKTTSEEVETEYVDHLATDRDIIVAAFFYSFRGGKTETSHTLMLRSLLYQILEGNSKFFPSFQSAYRELLKTEGSPEWSYEVLKSVFISLRSTRTPLKIYIIVDAMDESDESQRPEILDFLSETCSSESLCIFKGLIASRFHPDIRTRLDKCSHIILQDENRADIETVINKGLENISNHHEIPQEKLVGARKYLIEHCDGVFLWVSIVLRELEDQGASGITSTSIMKLLTSLPVDIVELYKHIVEKLKGKHDKLAQERGRKMIVWTAFAERPMVIEELGDAIIISPNDQPFTPRDDFFSTERIISSLETLIAYCCGGLLEIRLVDIVQPLHQTTKDFIRPDSIVQLLHQTARDFILDNSRAAEPFDTNELQADMEIATVCLRYLRLILKSRGSEGNETQKTQDFVDELSDRPLLDYTLAFLPTHLDHLRKNQGVPEFVNGELTILIEILQKNPQSQAYNLLERWCEKDLGHPIGLTIDVEFARQSRNEMLVIAAGGGDKKVVTSLLRAHAEINGSTGGLSPVGAAAVNGHDKVVQLLVNMKADVDMKDNDGKTPLLCAAERGHDAVVRLLLESGAELESRDESGQTPLSWAAERGHDAVVRLLLEKGAELESKDDNGQTPLLWAAERGHEAVVRLLLERGAELDS